VEARDPSNGSASGIGEGGSSIAESLIGGLDSVQQHYATAYSAAELKTFHCEQVRKMPMSGLDPSMLIGFLCRDDAEWVDLKRRVAELPRTIFSIQDEPPSWTIDSDDNLGLESFSDPEDEEDGDEDGEGEEDEDGVEIEVEADVEEEDERQEQHRRAKAKAKKRRENNDNGSDEFYDTQSRSSAEGGSSGARRTDRSRSDTEEDPVGPITPGPGARFAMPGGKGSASPVEGRESAGDDDDDDDDWVDPSVPSPPPSRRSTAPVMVELPSAGATGNGRQGKGRKKTGPGLVPVVRPPVLPHSGSASSKKGGKAKSKSSRYMRSGWEGEEEQEEQEHYLFPSAGADDEADGYGSEDATPLDRSRVNTATATATSVGIGEDAVVVVSTGKRMNTARARDGGRTQSGGVRGVLTE